jgi:hypothetical protein
MQARVEMLAGLGFSVAYSGDQLADMPPQDWEVLLERARVEKAERDRAANEEWAKLERQRKEQQAEQARIDAEKKRLADEAAERQRQDELDKARQEAAERAKREAVEKARRDAEEAQRQREAEEVEAKRIAALRPDHEKLIAVADAVASIEVPTVSQKANAAAIEVENLLANTANQIRTLANKLVEKKTTRRKQPAA